MGITPELYENRTDQCEVCAIRRNADCSDSQVTVSYEIGIAYTCEGRPLGFTLSPSNALDLTDSRCERPLAFDSSRLLGSRR